jgi:hypothetical protein
MRPTISCRGARARSRCGGWRGCARSGRRWRPRRARRRRRRR